MILKIESKLKTVLALIALFILIFISDINRFNLFNHNYKTLPNHTIEARVSPRVYRIIIWSSKWPNITLDQYNCPFNNCIATENRTDLTTSDAIVFHWRDIDVNDWPLQHSLHQKWVLLNYESPIHTFTKYKLSEDILRPLFSQIDWTMTYRFDSDIYTPYGSVTKCGSNLWHNEDVFDSKTKGIAWVVSNCKTSSDREGYVERLNKYMRVDVYGNCGQYNCTRNPDCFPGLMKTYKFYLAFENSLCKEYVTEKLFRTLQYDIIPIVYGSADYKQLLPENSYINIKDFPSAKELADYLKVVANDSQIYNSYLKWKSDFCVKVTGMFTETFCNLCEKLNQNSDQIQTNGKDLFNWWSNPGVCQSPH